MNATLIENLAQARIAELIAEAEAHRRAKALRQPRGRRKAVRTNNHSLVHRLGTRLTASGRRVTKSLPSS